MAEQQKSGPAIPDRPGLGIELDFDFINHFLVA
jgi:hypothetical protein